MESCRTPGGSGWIQAPAAVENEQFRTMSHSAARRARWRPRDREDLRNLDVTHTVAPKHQSSAAPAIGDRRRCDRGQSSARPVRAGRPGPTTGSRRGLTAATVGRKPCRVRPDRSRVKRTPSQDLRSSGAPWSGHASSGIVAAAIGDGRTSVLVEGPPSGVLHPPGPLCSIGQQGTSDSLVSRWRPRRPLAKPGQIVPVDSEHSALALGAARRPGRRGREARRHRLRRPVPGPDPAPRRPTCRRMRP